MKTQIFLKYFAHNCSLPTNTTVPSLLPSLLPILLLSLIPRCIISQYQKMNISNLKFQLPSTKLWLGWVEILTEVNWIFKLAYL